MLYTDKKELRAFCRKCRAEIPADRKAAIEEQMAEHIIRSPFFKEASVLLCYAGFGSEIRTDAVLRAGWQAGKTVCLPRCADREGRMAFYRTASPDVLQKGMYGIAEPNESCPEEVCFSEKSLCLVPGLAFDERGFRIGYGRGYYDRFLPGFPGMTLGICPDILFFSGQRWEYDRYDRAVDGIVTENGLQMIK